MLKLLKYNTKLIFSYNVIASLILAILTFLFFNMSNSDFINLAKMGELYLSFSGMFLFVYLAGFEENRETNELVYSREISYIIICLIRIIEILFVNIIILLIPISIVYLNSNILKFGQGFLGIVISSWFLGLFSMFIAELTQNHRIGYLIGFIYYFFETSTKGIYNRKFQVFGYSYGNFSSKINVFILCILMIILELLIIQLKLKGVFKSK